MERTALVLVLLVVFAQLVPGVTIGQIDNFESGIAGWFAGGGPFGATPPVPPTVVGGGQGGPNDDYLRVTSGGGAGSGSRLVVMNQSQWAGNYLNPGISNIQMDLINLGTTGLTIRLYFEDPIPGPPMNEAVTLFGFNLPAGSGWQHAVFPVGPASLAVLQGSANVLLTNTTVLRIMHNPDTTFPPPSIVAQVGIDNVTAAPEPGAIWLTLFGGSAVCLIRRRRMWACPAGR
ncbi:MAG TPA: PEP-CTERM sorting domain-containing protein [Bryobacteraceae bacterium]|nr:PEP-CTERM sorting domain-containing protein [Bryobacteraceae bacterium]